MIATAMFHALAAIAVQLGLWWFLGLDLITAGAYPVVFYLAREFTQHEYKLSIRRGWVWGQKLKVKPLEGLYKGWSKDSLLDVLFPVAAVAAVAIWAPAVLEAFS